MFRLVYSPTWFYGKDLLIDVVSVVVLLLIAFTSVKYYKLNKRNKNYLYLAIAFTLMAASFLFKILTNFSIYYIVLETKTFGFITLVYKSVKYSNLPLIIGFLMYRVTMLLGLLLLYKMYVKPKNTSFAILTYLILVSSYFSRHAYYMFHLTALIFLCIITLHYWKNYKRLRKPSNKWLAYSFALITLSQVVFVFVSVNELFYVTAELFQLTGYAGLLITLIKVLKKGKNGEKTRKK